MPAKETNPTCAQMISEYLRLNGFSGLYNEECGCELDDLMPCGGDAVMGCRAGYKHPGCPPECGEGCAFHILARKIER